MSWWDVFYENCRDPQLLSISLFTLKPGINHKVFLLEGIWMPSRRYQKKNDVYNAEKGKMSKKTSQVLCGSSLINRFIRQHIELDSFSNDNKKEGGAVTPLCVIYLMIDIGRKKWSFVFMSPQPI